jgi:hypothetical protein
MTPHRHAEPGMRGISTPVEVCSSVTTRAGDAIVASSPCAAGRIQDQSGVDGLRRVVAGPARDPVFLLHQHG